MAIMAISIFPNESGGMLKGLLGMVHPGSGCESVQIKLGCMMDTAGWGLVQVERLVW